MAVGPQLYEESLKRGMIEKFKLLRINVTKNRNIQNDNRITPNFISGGFNGIFWALGCEMDRKKGIDNSVHMRTGPIAYEEAMKIENLVQNLEDICAVVNPTKNYSGMLRELGKVVTEKHGTKGER